MPTETVLGHDVYYEAAGDKGPPIVLLHGIPTHSVQWRPVQELLAPYARTYAVDLLGFGRSDKPLEGWEYTFHGDAEIVTALLDALGHDDAIMVGDDFGGGIALILAAAHGDRTDLCAVQSPVVYDQWPVAEVELLARWHRVDEEMLDPLGDKAFEFQAQQLPMLLALMLRRMVARPANLTGRDLREYRAPYETVDYGRGGSFLEGNAGYGDLRYDAIRALAKRAATVDPNWMADLDYGGIECPTLVLWGSEDQFMDPGARHRLKRDVSNAPVRVELIEDAGHLGMIDRPHVVADRLLDFVTEYRGVDALARSYDGFPELDA